MLAGGRPRWDRNDRAFNLRDFPEGALAPWRTAAFHPQDYLLTLYGMSSAVVLAELTAIANDHDQELQDTLIRLGKGVPAFSTLFSKTTVTGPDRDFLFRSHTRSR